MACLIHLYEPCATAASHRLEVLQDEAERQSWSVASGWLFKVRSDKITRLPAFRSMYKGSRLDFLLLVKTAQDADITTCSEGQGPENQGCVLNDTCISKTSTESRAGRREDQREMWCGHTPVSAVTEEPVPLPALWDPWAALSALFPKNQGEGQETHEKTKSTGDPEGTKMDRLLLPLSSDGKI